MIVATPCSELTIMPMAMDFQNALNKNPSRFEMTSDESRLWEILKKVHKEHFKPGTPLKAVNEVVNTFWDFSIIPIINLDGIYGKRS